jgi:hypothetical protein
MIQRPLFLRAVSIARLVKTNFQFFNPTKSRDSPKSWIPVPKKDLITVIIAG